MAVKTSIAPQPWMQLPDTVRVMDVLDKEGGNPRFVGGCVRNALLFKPIEDVDIGTVHRPEKVMMLCEANGLKAKPTGIDHGTVTVISGSTPFEVTTLRADMACDGRHAEVVYTDDWEKDAARRDFTINAMSMERSGKIYDYYNGKKDLEEGVVQFVGDAEQRIQEDYLRILRLFRFHALYGAKPLEKPAIDACRHHVRGIVKLSGERIQKEMFKLFAAPDPGYALRMMAEADVLRFLIPLDIHPIPLENIPALIRLEREVLNIKDFYIDPMARFTAIMPPVVSSNYKEKESFLRKLHDRWKFSKRDREHLWRLLCPPHYISSDLLPKIQHKIIMRVGKHRFISSVLIYLAIEAIRYPERRKEIADICREMIRNTLEWQMPVFPVSGRDLIALGIEPGIDIGKLLDAAEIFWEEQEYKATKQQVIEFIKLKYTSKLY